MSSSLVKSFKNKYAFENINFRKCKVAPMCLLDKTPKELTVPEISVAWPELDRALLK